MSGAEFDAVYFDGQSSRRNAVRIRKAGDRLEIVGEGVALDVPLGEARVEPPISGRAHLIHLPGGALVRLDDEAAIEALFPGSGTRGYHWVRLLERRWSAALASLVFVGAVIAWTFIYGLPLGARIAAEKIPDSVWDELGQQTLAVLDKGLCEPSLLAPERKAEVLRGLDRISRAVGDPGDYYVEFRSCKPIGPNALALPGGSIVITDQLVSLAKNNDQIVAVLAHEMGHLKYHHPTRVALQGAGVAAVIATLASDAVSITGLAAALPTLLLQTGYSRAFEEEADGFALARVKQVGISPHEFANILELLEQAHAKHTGGSAAKDNDYLSTHPATAARIERARAAGGR